MGKILFTQSNEGGQLNLIAGTITELRDGGGAAAGKVKNVSMDVSVREGKENVHKVLDIGLWNNEKDASVKRKQLADRAANAKLGAGSFVLLTCGTLSEKTTKSGAKVITAPCFDFSYNSRRAFEVDTEKGIFTNEVICGTIRRVHLEGEHPFVVVPINTFKGGEQGTDWITLFLKSDDETAKKYMAVGVPIAALTSQVHETPAENGHVNMAASVFNYVIGQAKK